MALPFVGISSTTRAQLAQAIASRPANVRALVDGVEPEMQALRQLVRDRSQGEVAWPDNRRRCNCGPDVDSVEPEKTGGPADPNYCLKHGGPLSAPVLRRGACADMPQLFWPDIWDRAQAVLKQLLALPPANDDDPTVQANWTANVLELCTIMGQSTNLPAFLLNAWTVTPVNEMFVPEREVHLTDADDPRGPGFPVFDDNTSVPPLLQPAWSAYANTKTPGSPGTNVRSGSLPPTNYELPRLSADVQALWNAPPSGTEGTNIWLFIGNVEAIRPLYMKFDLFHLVGPGLEWTNWDNACSRIPMWTHEWVCNNSRYVSMLQGNVEAMKPGHYIADGVMAWPYSAVGSGGDDWHNVIARRRGDTRSQLTSLFTAMNGKWWDSGWAFYKEWHCGTGDILHPVDESEHWLRGVVPGPWWYMANAWRWGTYFAGLDYMRTVNSALYFYSCVYVPALARHYGASIDVAQLTQHINQKFAAANARALQQSQEYAGAFVGFAAAVAAALVIEMASVIGIVAVLIELILAAAAAGFVALVNEEEQTKFVMPIYSPLLRTPTDRDCHYDVTMGLANLETALPGVITPAGTMAYLSTHPELIPPPPQIQQAIEDHRAANPPPLSTPAKVGIGALGVALVGGLLLALRGK